ncbi:MAG: response regulator transcription factor [Bacteroidetes bacterium]|nr:response regulator transcription factor [Bacteroidota bacterium]
MESKLKALIVDDEEGARKLLKKLLDETHHFTDLRLADSASSATTEMKDFDPDMVFLDIRMPEKDGFDFLMDMSHRNGRPGIVFVTAYEQYALKAIKQHAFDYLLKPVNRKELKQCIQKYISGRSENASQIPQPVHQVLTDKIKRVKVSTRTGTLFVNPANILYCKADGNYTVIHSGGKELLCSMNIGKLREMLPETSFLRIGRSLILNIEHITHLDRRQSIVTLVNQGESVSVKIPRNHLKELEMI